MINNFGGYTNYTEWKKSDPDAYWAFINAKYEKIKSGGDNLWRDEDYVKLKESLPDPSEVSPFNSMIGRQLADTLTLWDEECTVIVGKGKTHPLYNVFDRYIDGLSTKKDLKKIERINKGLNPDVWFVRLWKWFKRCLC